ncbi:DnaD domain protein [Lysinibacillus xylanilyticus]|uniref:DnaD domain protein n=1 Tax=Lysinibacillus xylanilyticus TaxID=582475 RepID=UPI0037FBB1DA
MQHAQKLYEFFVSRMKKFPSDKLREDIDYYLATYQDADLIIEAFERSLINGRVTNKEKYATGTLRNWKHEGVTSSELLEQKEVQKLAGNQGNDTGNGYNVG